MERQFLLSLLGILVGFAAFEIYQNSTKSLVEIKTKATHATSSEALNALPKPEIENIDNDNRAYSELYVLRGDIYKAQGQRDKAKTEYELAVKYNINFLVPRERLQTL